jgi:hypothetical protein
VKDRLDQARGSFHESGSASIQKSDFLPAQKGAVSSPLSFAGRIAKPLRGGGGGVVPSAATQPPAATVVSPNPLTRVQNEERYAIISFIIVASLDSCYSGYSGGKFRMCRISLSHTVTHCDHRQARIMVFPVSMNGCIICCLSVLVLYPTLVVRSIGRHTLYLQTRTYTSPMHVHTMKLKRYQDCRRRDDVRTFRGVEFFF